MLANGMNKYQIVYSISARKELTKLPKSSIKRIAMKILSLSNNPRPRGCIKISGEEKYWRIRVGNYRIVYFVDDDSEKIKIRIIAHRKDAYR